MTILAYIAVTCLGLVAFYWLARWLDPWRER